ncbi:MAG TPA: FAD-binding protein, partial [Desulfitobacterium dehalogenans]|nr:FAD-binding protein [Desulfitobacterium dehalogenans]
MVEKKTGSEEKKLSRRDFLRNTSILAGGAVLGTGLLAGCSEGAAKDAPAPATQTWDYEADVVVIGLGGAGASAAIEAYDAGAKVLVIEKQAEKAHYPNTRMSG